MAFDPDLPVRTGFFFLPKNTTSQMLMPIILLVIQMCLTTLLECKAFLDKLLPMLTVYILTLKPNNCI